MSFGLSPHAKTLVELIENVRSLARHHKYVEARDVMRALAILGKDFGFEIPPDMIGDLVDDLGHVNPIMTKSMLDGFATFIAGLDDKLDKESLTGVDYGRPNITRLSPSSKHPTEPDK